MENPLSEMAINAIGMILLVYLLSMFDPLGQTVSAVADKSTGLEKVQTAQLVDNLTTQGVIVSGGDVIGAVRYYQGTTPTQIVVSGWGAARTYSTTAINRALLFSDFPSLSSSTEFYSARFSVSVNSNVVTYTKL